MNFYFCEYYVYYGCDCGWDTGHCIITAVSKSDALGYLLMKFTNTDAREWKITKLDINKKIQCEKYSDERNMIKK